MGKVEKTMDINQLYLTVRAMIGNVKKRCNGEEVEQIDAIRQLTVKISESKDADFRCANLAILQEELNKFYTQEQSKLDAMKTKIFIFEKGEDRINTKLDYTRLLRITYMLQKIEDGICQLIAIEAAQQSTSEIVM